MCQELLRHVKMLQLRLFDVDSVRHISCCKTHTHSSMSLCSTGNCIFLASYEYINTLFGSKDHSMVIIRRMDGRVRRVGGHWRCSAQPMTRG